MLSFPPDSPTLPDHLLAPDGTRLHLSHWPVTRPRGVVQTLHGFGEHQGRIEPLAQAQAGPWRASTTGTTVALGVSVVSSAMATTCCAIRRNCTMCWAWPMGAFPA